MSGLPAGITHGIAHMTYRLQRQHLEPFDRLCQGVVVNDVLLLIERLPAVPVGAPGASVLFCPESSDGRELEGVGPHFFSR